APYLGEGDLTAPIEQAGGLRTWRPPEQVTQGQGLLAPGNLTRMWETVRLLPQARLQRRVFLGYGSGDRFGGGSRLLQGVLPPGQWVVTEGGHDWETWRRVLRRLLEGEAGERLRGVDQAERVRPPG
ncbi:MAG TPA: hypothetical protein VNX25_07780, partial [Verrucomicrobiae bacterium]|nr:hypothetical protein [Verrucomicrobiae bacterium]